MGEFDTDYKLFYRPLIDFGKGVGINESMEKYNLEEMNRRNQEQIQMDNIGMSDNENLDFFETMDKDEILIHRKNIIDNFTNYFIILIIYFVGIFKDIISFNNRNIF